MDLVRDLLDMKLVDRNGRELGRVDSIVLDVPESGPPRVAAIELGPAVLANRVHPLLGRWAAAIEHAFGIDEGQPLRIPFAAVIDIGGAVRVDLAFGETSAATVELRQRRVVGSIPGSS